MSVIRRAMVIVMVLCGVALAAPSGGSVGGGSWGGGGASRGGSWGGGGTGVGYGLPAVPAQPTSGDWRGVALLALGLAMIAVVVMAPRRPRVWRGSPREAHVAELNIAFAPGARTALTSALLEVARDATPASAEGRAELLHELSLLLRRHASDAAYVGCELAVAPNRADGRSLFHRAAYRARARFVEERIRNNGERVVERVAPTIERERSGFTVVTLVLMTGAPLLEPVRDRESLDAALQQLGNVLPFAVIACDVSWMPADRGEALSSLVVEQRLPNLTKLPDAIAGPCRCAYCGARYSIEHATCPRCGAHPHATSRSADGDRR